MKIGDIVKARIEWTRETRIFLIPAGTDHLTAIVQAKIIKFNPEGREVLIEVLEGSFTGQTHWIHTKNIMEG